MQGFTRKSDIYASGSLVQAKFYSTGSLVTGSNATPWPNDDTVPTSSQGDEFFTYSFTPLYTDSELLITVWFSGVANSGSYIIAWLLKNSETTALACGFGADQPYLTNTFSFKHKMTAGTTSAITFKVRAGQPGSAGYTTSMNGKNGGTRVGGGTLTSGIEILEVRP